MADKTHEGQVLILRVTVLKMTTQEALVSRTLSYIPQIGPRWENRKNTRASGSVARNPSLGTLTSNTRSG